MMAEGDKSLGEEHRESLDRRNAQLKERYGDDLMRFPLEPVNRKGGTCLWCGNRQAQILVVNDDEYAGDVRYGYEGGRYVSGLTKARVCLTCGRVELTDSKPER